MPNKEMFKINKIFWAREAEGYIIPDLEGKEDVIEFRIVYSDFSDQKAGYNGN